MTAGLVSPETPFPLDVAAHVTGAKALISSYMGSCNPAVDIPKFIELHERGLFPVEKLITHRLALGQVNEALERMAESGALRQILTP